MLSNFELFFRFHIHTYFQPNNENPIPIRTFLCLQIENLATRLLEDVCYWTEGKQNTGHCLNENLSFLPRPILLQLDTKTAKIRSITKAMLSAFPGFLLKATAWSIHPSFIRQRHACLQIHAYNQLKCQTTLANLNKHSFSSIKIASYDAKKNRMISLLPNALQSYVTSFMTVQDYLHLARTCRTNFHTIHHPSHLAERELHFWPSTIVQALGIKRFQRLDFHPFGHTLQGFDSSIEAEWTDKSSTSSHPDIPSLEQVVQEAQTNLIDELTSTNEKASSIPAITKVCYMSRNNNSTPKTVLIVRLQRSIGSNTVLTSIIFANLDHQWRAITNSHHIPTAMKQFLNKMNNPIDKKHVQAYLMRLFRGEPCGDFSASNSLSDSPKEGSRTLLDGRSVIQLHISIRESLP